jgi:hypothetical protein
MEQFVLVGEFGDQDAVNRACSLLESQEVPVMVDHWQRDSGLGSEVVYRVLVPVELSQRSLAALSGMLPRFDTTEAAESSLPRA